ncbi:threonine/serine ThrE exporter family protein [Prevotellamassilia timonensis]|uniref:threonine/serine ThrE exporter family protein n=1 Tax=Prevotellamassilia timonensis TaxID=1852370 RepID=UPI0040275F58
MTTNSELTREQLIRHKLDLLLRTGQLLVESAADTNRIVRNMNRVAAFLGLPEEHLHIYVQFNMLMVNLSDDEHSFTKFQRCNKHGINMTTISLISKLSWKAIRQDYSIEQYAQELEEIANRPRNYTPVQVAIGTGFACGGFCIQFGCDWTAFFYASFAAAIGMYLRGLMLRKGLNNYMGIAIAAFISTVIAWATTYLPPSWTSTPLHPLLACALFIVPGVPLINFVDDMLDNYIQVGLTRAINTFLMIVAMSFGIAFFLKLSNFDLTQFYTIPMIPHNSYLSYAAAAAISAMGFSMIFNIPRRLLWVVAIGGIIAVCTRNFVNLGPSNDNIGLDMGLAIGSLAGSALASLIAVKAVHWVHAPNHVLSIPSVIPMVPGVLMYRALVGLIEMNGVVGELTNAMKFGMASAVTIMCIALGVAIPNVFARRWVAKDRQRKLNQLIEERRKRGHFIDLAKL